MKTGDGKKQRNPGIFAEYREENKKTAVTKIVKKCPVSLHFSRLTIGGKL